MVVGLVCSMVGWSVRLSAGWGGGVVLEDKQLCVREEMREKKNEKGNVNWD